MQTCPNVARIIRISMVDVALLSGLNRHTTGSQIDQQTWKGVSQGAPQPIVFFRGPAMQVIQHAPAGESAALETHRQIL